MHLIGMAMARLWLRPCRSTSQTTAHLVFSVGVVAPRKLLTAFCLPLSDFGVYYLVAEARTQFTQNNFLKEARERCDRSLFESKGPAYGIKPLP